MEEKNIRKKNEAQFNYLTPTKSTSLKRLPAHSCNNSFYKNPQNLLNKFKECANKINIINIKSMNNGNISSQKFERKQSLFLPLINNKNKNINFNSSVNNGINGFRKGNKKSLDFKDNNTSLFQINNNDNTNEHIKININENNDEKNNNDISHLYKTKLNSCKEVRIRKKFFLK